MEPVRPIRINLLRAEQQPSTTQVTILVSLIAGIAVFGLMVGIYAIGLHQLHGEQALNKKLNAQYQGLIKSNNSLQAQIKPLEDMKNRKSMIDTISNSRIPYLDLMNEVEKAAPESVILYNLDMQKNDIIISGRAENEGQIAVFLAGLRVSPWFTTLKTVSINDEGKSTDGLLRFDIQYEWEVAR